MKYRSLIAGFVLVLISVAGTLRAQAISPDSILISPAHNEVVSTIPVTFRWHSVPLTDYYSFRITTDSLSTERVYTNGVIDTSLTVTFLPSDSLMWWKVTAIRFPDSTTIDTIVRSTTRRFRTTAVYPGQLVSPINNTKALDTSVTLVWQRVETAEKYILEVSQTPVFTSVLSDTLSDTMRVVDGLIPSTSYFWKVKPLRADSLGVWSGQWRFSTKTVPVTRVPLATPKDSAVFPVIDTNTTFRNFTWFAVVAATNYQIQVSYSPFFDVLIADDTTSGKYEHMIKLFFEDAIYYWHVRAYNELGWGEWSETRQFYHSIFNSVRVEEKNDIVVFPNPAVHSVTIRGSSLLSGATLEFSNTLGRVLSKEAVVAENMEAVLSLEGVPSGMYYLLVKTKDGTHMIAKVTKQ